MGEHGWVSFIADCIGHVMDNIINGVGGKVCRGVGGILSADSGFEEEEEFHLKLVSEMVER